MPKKIVINGVIGWDVYPGAIRRQLENSNEEIIVEISSPGGSVFDGIEIFNIINDYSKNINKVTMRIVGLAASMASYIALAGNRTIATDNSTFMIHNVWSFDAGDHRELRKTADMIEKLSDLLAQKYSQRTGKSMSEVRKLMDDETWLTGQSIIDGKFADEIEITGRNEDAQTLMTVAKGRVQSCFAMMEKSERSKNDLQKACAFLQNYVISEPKTQEKIIENKKTEENNSMDYEKIIAEKDAQISTFKAENSKLKAEIENISAHLEFADIAPSEVLAAIKNKEDFSVKTHSAKYAKIQILNAQKQNRVEDNVGELNTEDSNNEDEKVDEVVAAYNKMYGGVK